MTRNLVSWFVGRAAELERLALAVDTVRLVIVHGGPGIGKTALVRQFAARWTGRVLAPRIVVGHLVGELLDELRRACPGAARPPGAQADRIADLAARLDRDLALIVLDDVDRMDRDGLAAVAALADRLQRARIVATAQCDGWVAGAGVLGLALDGLDRAAAAALWRQLGDQDGGCADRPGFEAAWSASHGNPLYLQRAHAGDAGEPAIAALEAGARALVTALAVTELALPISAVVGALPDGVTALAQLAAGRLIEPAGGDRIELHSAVRQAVLRAADSAELACAHGRIAALLPRVLLDPVVMVRERFRHLRAADQLAAARELVLTSAADLVRLGGAGELLRCLDALPDADDLALRRLRARVQIRLLDLRSAFDELSQLTPHRDDRQRAQLAHVAMLSGRYDLAERLCRTALTGDPAPGLTLRYAITWMLTRTYQGHGPDARERLAGLLDGASAVSAGHLRLVLALSLWLEDRDAEAEAMMREAWALLDGAISIRTCSLTPLLWATALARAGKLDEAHAVRRSTEGVLADAEDPLTQVMTMLLRAVLLEAEGRHGEAVTELAEAERGLERGGHHMGVPWAHLLRGRLLVRLGRVRNGQRMLDDVCRHATASGARLLVRLAERARYADPRYAVAAEPGPLTARPAEQRRERVIAALRTVAAAPLALARDQLAALDLAALDPLEQALAVLGHAMLDRRAGDDVLADAGLARAAELAAAAGADPELVGDLARWLYDAAARAERRVPVVVCRKTDTVRVAGQVIAFRTRPALRRLLYTMLAEPERSFDKASLASALWPSQYRPDRHDGALWVNVKRLRDLLSGSGLCVRTEPHGYRVATEDGYQLVLS
jgi:hypothetical protein